MSIKKKIQQSMTVILTVTLVLAYVILSVILYNRNMNLLQTEVKQEAAYIREAINLSDSDYMKQMDNVVESTRVTQIKADGTVLYDNQADAATMENHGDRKEIQEALKTGSGHAERTSKTLSQKTLYYALRLSDNSVLRVSSTQYSVWVLLMELVPPLIGIAVVMLILTAIMSVHMANKIVEPINNVDLEHPEENQIYEEVGPLLSKIYKQNRQIKSQLEAARRNQEEFGIITENMQEGLLVIDSYTMILSGNSSAWKLFQLKDPKIGDSVYSLNRNEDFRLLIEQVLKGQHGSVLLHMGSEAIQMIANPVNREHRVVGAVILLMNETEKVEREQLRREFSANVSHELKTPLTSISGFAEIIQDGLVKEEDIKKFAGRIYNEAQRLITLVEDIIKLSKLDEGNVELEKEEVDLYKLTREILTRLSPQAAKRKVHVEVTGEPVEYVGIRQILDEMIYNICENAIKYNKEGGKLTVWVGNTLQGKKICVTDTGIGIPENETDRIFERFYRVDKSHSKETGGTGLGLSIVKHGAMLHGAKIHVDSKLGEGTKIELIF